MKIDEINSGYVLDHITAGKAMEIYRFLHLDDLDCSVAVIRNVKSVKMGKKDIIKIDALIDMDMAVLGFIDPGITVNVVRDGVLTEKLRLSLPEELVNVAKCKNPRCITSTERELDHVFRLADRSKKIYRCIYCESKME